MFFVVFLCRIIRYASPRRNQDAMVKGLNRWKDSLREMIFLPSGPDGNEDPVHVGETTSAVSDMSSSTGRSSKPCSLVNIKT